jgi:DNA-binding response OmpR family regulator
MKKIFAIDDEPGILTCLKNALSAHGYEIQVSNDPEEGLETLKTDEDIVLAMLDIRMPGKNGFEIYQELREVRHIPVLFVTAFPKSFSTNSEDIVEMWKKDFSDGTTDIIYKPFNLQSLYDKVEGLIGTAEENASE